MFEPINFIFFGYLVIVGSYKIVEGKSLATETNGEKNISEVCSTSECQDLSNLFINSLNKTADPCDDFYNYACGSYPTNYPVPKEEIVWNHRQNMTKNIQYELIKILQEEPKPEDSVPLSVEKKLFKACIHEDRIERNSIEGLSKVIEGLGGWPMLMEENKWKEADFPWQKVMQGYIQHNVATPLFSIDYTPDPKNYSINVISLKHGIGSDILKDICYQVHKGEILSEDMIHRIDFPSPWLYNGFTRNRFNVSNFFEKSHRLLTVMSVIEVIEAFYSEEGKEKKTIREFQNYYNRNNSTKNTSEINWLEMIRAYTKDSKLNIDDSEEILIIGDKSYFDTLFKIFDKISHYDIVNYLHWNFMTSQFVNLKRYNREYIKKLKERITGIPVYHKNRTEECIEQQWLKAGVSKEYLKRNFPNNFSEYAKEVAEEIRNEIDTGILRANWMDATAKLSAREKLRATKVQIGYPKYFDDEKEFNQLYDGLEVGLDHFDNEMKIKEFERVQKLNELREPFKGNEWSFMNPLMLNAVYHPYHNRITVPAAKLLPKSDNMQLMLLYYAASGHTIGHEFSHAFTTGGRKYDKQGNFASLWSDSVEKNFTTKADCYIKQYNDYGINGELTLAENIADSLGLSAAYSAFLKKAERYTDLKLPNLENVTRNQLFFLNFANRYCETRTKSNEELQNNDVHAKASVRINGAVANVKGFAEAFQCSENSPMNPTNRCILWE